MDGGLRIVLRTLVILGLAVGLLFLFLRNADLDKVVTSVKAARIDYLLASLALTCVTFLIRTERWQYLLAPLGPTRFMVVLRTTSCRHGPAK